MLLLAISLLLFGHISSPTLYAEPAPLPLYKQPAQNLKMPGQSGYPDTQVSPKPGWKTLPQRRGDRVSDAPWWAHVLLWVPNRFLDLIDVFRVDAGIGPAAGGVIRVTRHAQMGYRRMLPFSLRVGDFGRQTPFALETDDEIGAGDTFRPSGDRSICTGEIGLGLDLGLGAYAGICPESLVDFFAGLIFIDLESDDIR